MIAAFIAMVVVVGEVFLLRTMEPALSPTPIAQQSPPPTPSPQVLDTSNWQTYRNEQFGFEVDLPSTSFRQIPISIVTGKNSLKEYLDELEVLRSSAVENGPSVSVIRRRNITVAKHPATQQEIYLLAGGIHEIETFIDVTPRMIINIYTYANGNQTGVDESSFRLHQQILSTFRFVEQEKS